MTTYRRPGTYIEETLLASNIQSTGLETSLAAFVGQALRGPVDRPVMITSWTDFTRRFGMFRSADGMTNYRLAMAVNAFFSNGGRGAWIQRVAGTGAQQATAQLTDSGAQPVLTVNAIDPGQWAIGNVYVQITDVNATGGGGVAQDGDTFTLTVFSGGTSAAYVVESWTDLSLSPASPLYAPDVVNNNSGWLQLARPAGVTGYLPPMPGAAVALANPSGVTGSLDGAAPTVDAYTAVPDLFDTTPSNLVFNVPDAYDMTATDATTVYNAFTLKADSRGDSFVVIDVPHATETTAASASSWVNGLNASGNAAVYYPSLRVQNPISGSRGGLITVPPGGSVIGLYHATDSARGVFKSPAGVGASLNNAYDTSLALTPNQMDDLNTAVKPVNSIRAVPGAGICVMGGRTLGGTRDTRYVNSRRTMLEIKKALKERVEFAVFENNDTALWEKVRTVCGVYLNGLWQAGGLKGAAPSQAFYVKCDSTNNSAADIDNGLLTVEVGVALQVPTEFVVVRIGQFDGSTSVDETPAQ